MSTPTADVPTSAVPIRRAYVEVLMSLGTVALLLIALVALDERVRERASGLFNGGASVELTTAGNHVRSFTHVIASAARTQSLAHAPLLVFGLVSAVLVVIMLRT
jgi:hypothetical protein